MVNSEGSVFIATANDNAVGMYSCTAYNSYGTMGRSEATQVILKVRRIRPFFTANTLHITVTAGQKRRVSESCDNKHLKGEKISHLIQ